MKLYRPRKVEWLSFIVLMPFITSGCNYLLFEERFLHRDVLLQSTSIMYGVGFLAWYTHVSLTQYINNRYNHYRDITKKVAWLMALHISIMASSMAVYFFGYDYFHHLDYHLNVERYIWSVVIFFVITLIATATWSFTYTIHKWKEGLSEKERLQQENLQTEFESLKDKVNPHFLFNSLNSLSALIEEDPERAEAFVDEMSKVYRYMLRSNRDGITPLFRELQFIRSFYHLLKTRYCDGIEMHIRVEEEYMEYLIPTLTLQLLVENSVTYNNILKHSPLQIVIATTDTGKLLVTHNRQQKAITVNAGRTGLDTIKNKYRLLHQPELVIREDENEFSVLLPLIKAN